MENEVVVGIGGFAVVKTPCTVLTIGLGSCVGICLYDRRRKIAGLAHIMLPDSSKVRNNSSVFKFADTAIPLAIEEMVKQGAFKANLVAKIAGGAQMFKSASNSFQSDIGSRNIAAVEEALKKSGIFIIEKDVGGNDGRTMIVNSQTGLVTIKSRGKEVITF